jgi:predicted negative regulator of RcsB-dependent stress response
VEHSGRRIILGPTPVFAWRNWESHDNPQAEQSVTSSANLLGKIVDTGDYTTEKLHYICLETII